MKKLMGFIARRGGAALALMALLVGTASVNVTCAIWYHQPEVPQGMERYKRHK